MAFTLQDAAMVWENIQPDQNSTTPVSVLKGNWAMDMAGYQSNADMEKTLREIFQRAGVEYPEKTHVLHLRTTMLTALSKLKTK
ncbi:hypothetical protein [Sporomusa aerivorans]|uniref:hypothetical protein n=1 Tax=Sporomusa aerivorans TaxID=204936 RepID=UPI00352ADC8D